MIKGNSVFVGLGIVILVAAIFAKESSVMFVLSMLYIFVVFVLVMTGMCGFSLPLVVPLTVFLSLTIILEGIQSFRESNDKEE